jgi:hypothetical protein
MNQIDSLFSLRLETNVLRNLIVEMLESAGLRVICSFDLQAACSSFEANICPDHGEQPCDCQMMVLLVYENGSSPLSLVMHSHNGRAQVGIREDESETNRALESLVRRLLDTSRVVKQVRRNNLVAR